MRILLLTILFVAPVYFLTRTPQGPERPAIDAIKLKMGAPERAAPARAIVDTEIVAKEEIDAPAEESNYRSPADTEVPEAAPEEEAEVPEVATADAASGWNDELKSTLGRLEPAEGEEIYNSYVKEQEAYQAEIEALKIEKEQKTSDLAASEVDQLISQLEGKHQERLKGILGPHYEAVRDQYQDYLEAAE